MNSTPLVPASFIGSSNASSIPPRNPSLSCQVHRTAITVLLFLVALTAALPTSAHADYGTSAAQSRAHTFLKTADHGAQILGYVHAGAAYHGHQFREVQKVVDNRGNEISGQFALIYRFNWESDGCTDLAFLCDAKGSVYKVNVVSTNAMFQQPFMVANGMIQVLGNVLIEAFNDSMTPDQRKTAQSLVDSANARGLLELALSLQQMVGN